MTHRCVFVALLTIATLLGLIKPHACANNTRWHHDIVSSSRLGSCGTWQREYIELHRNILAGRAPPRYAVAAVTSGLADSLVGGIGVFWYALLTRRAFVWRYVKRPGENIDDSDPVAVKPRLEWMYAQPHINWTSPFPDVYIPDPKIQLVEDKAAGILIARMLNHQGHEQIERIWQTTNLSTFGAGYPQVHIISNRGMTADLFRNPYHMQQLHAMGLQPETAYACAMSFLLAPHPHIQSRFAAAIRRLSDTAVLKIGIQIRTGDDTLKDQTEDDLDRYQAYFDCAQQAQDTRQQGYPGGVVWLLVTDSHSVRKQAVQRYGSRVVLPSQEVKLAHLYEPTLRDHNTTSYEAATYSAGENWLFGMTDVHVITRDSGFGRTAALRSMRWSSIYSISMETQRFWKAWRPLRAVPRKCGISDADSWWEVAQDYSRI